MTYLDDYNPWASFRMVNSYMYDLPLKREINSREYFKSIWKLKMNFGTDRQKQNESILSFDPDFLQRYKDSLTFKETRTFPPLSDPRCWFKFEIFPTNHDSDVIKNVQLPEGLPVEYIKHIELELGGSRIDVIYPSIFGALRRIYGMSDTELPFYLFKNGIPVVEYHTIQIRIFMKESVEINWGEFIENDNNPPYICVWIIIIVVCPAYKIIILANYIWRWLENIV